MNALVLIAHPDDEILFLGAHILQRPDWHWRTICMTHELDDWRGREFLASRDALNAEGVEHLTYTMLGMPDEDIPESSFIEWERAFLRHLDVFPEPLPDVVYTHNRVGEYGHPHHIACNVIARRAFPDTPVWEFFYPPLVSGAAPLWRQSDVDFATDRRKEPVFHAAYGGHWSALSVHQPQLMAFLISAGCDLVVR